MRWDNTPHYPDLSNAPHHFHDQAGNIQASPLTGNLLNDFEIVLNEIKMFMGL